MATDRGATEKAGPGGGQAGSERERALEMALSQIEKHFGKGSIMRLGENTSVGVDAGPDPITSGDDLTVASHDSL